LTECEPVIAAKSAVGVDLLGKNSEQFLPVFAQARRDQDWCPLGRSCFSIGSALAQELL